MWSTYSTRLASKWHKAGGNKGTDVPIWRKKADVYLFASLTPPSNFNDKCLHVIIRHVWNYMQAVFNYFSYNIRNLGSMQVIYGSSKLENCIYATFDIK